LTGSWPGDQFTEAFTKEAFYPLAQIAGVKPACDLDARVEIKGRPPSALLHPRERPPGLSSKTMIKWCVCRWPC